MRTIIAGSRGLGIEEVRQAMKECGWVPTVVLSGRARGVDRAGEQWAMENGIRVLHYPADWNLYGRSAGIKRNVVMAQDAEALVAVWDGVSHGTDHMITVAASYGLRTYVHRVA